MTAERSLSTGQERIGLGIAYAVIGIFVMSMFDAMAKFLGEGYGVVQLVFFRNLFGLGFVLLLLMRAGGLSGLRSSQPLLHGLRAFFALGGRPAEPLVTMLGPLAAAVSVDSPVA